MNQFTWMAPVTRTSFPSASVLASKIAPPTPPEREVVRAAVGQLIISSHAKLVLIRAPAGFGKTTVMVQARTRLNHENVHAAWLTLDSSDNDLPRFFMSLRAAIGQLGFDDGPGETPLNLIRSLGGNVPKFAIFLDEFEKLVEPAVIGLVRELIEHLPRNGQVVIGTRGLSNLAIGRLRVQGELLEIDAEHLRFTAIEAAQLFALRLAQPLAVEEIARLHRKTEGWAAALCLAVISLQRHGVHSDFIDRFSGTHRDVAAYLAEDVLAQQPPEIREFLLRTSILRQLNPSICNALNPRVDADSILDRLVATNLFLTPVEGEDRMWRYHSLFAAYLGAELRREKPDDVARLHLAAAAWYDDQQRPVPAIDHAIEGGDVPYALGLLRQHVGHFLEQGRMRLLSRWFDALPAESLASDPLLQMTAVWATSFTRGPWQAMELLQNSGCADSPDPLVRAHVNGARPSLLAMMDRYEDGYELGVKCLQHLPTLSPFADRVLRNSMGHIVSVLGQHSEAQRLLDTARSAQNAGVFIRMYTESMEGVLDLQLGRMREATARFRIAVGSTRTFSYNLTSGNAWAGILYAGAVYEAGDLQQAEHLLNVYLPLARDVGLPDHMIMGYRMRSRIAFQRGEIDQALRLLTELEHLGADRQVPRVILSAKVERARLLLMQGYMDASRDELRRADDAVVWERVARLNLYANDVDDVVIGKARWEITFGDSRAALQQLEGALAAALARGRLGRALKLRMLAALALHRTGGFGAAVAMAAPALRHACQEGYFQLILDEGPSIVTLLELCLPLAQGCDGTRENPILGEYLQRLLQSLGPLPASESQAVGAPAELNVFEALTPKEIRVLRLLAEGYSNAAMAEKLFVSDSTVRTHLRSINGKLNARSRTQAVAIARRLGVIK